ncbi:hypothetical protein LZT04_02560, partial [Vibrio fluvialis]|nr:hypothetical protein [Vibrio fluvialis]
MNVIAKGGSAFLIHIAGALLGLLTQILAASFLGAEQYGRANYLLGYVGVISIFFFFGFHYYLSKSGSTGEELRLLMSKAVYTTTIIFSISLIPIVLYLKQSITVLEISIVMSISLFMILMEISKSYRIADEKPVVASRIKNFDTKISTLLICLVFYIFDCVSYEFFLMATMLGFAYAGLPTILKNIKITTPSLNIIRLSSTFYLVQVTYFFYSYFSKIVQMDVGNASLVAVLSIALIMGQLINMIGTNFANVVLPHFAKYFKSGDIKSAENCFMDVARINAYLSLPLAIIVVSKYNILLGVLGETYLIPSAKEIILFVVLGQFINSFVGPNGSVLLMGGKEKFEIVNGTVKILVGVSVAYILGPIYGWGIAFSLFFAELVVNLIKLIQVYCGYGFLPYKLKELGFILTLFCIQVIIISCFQDLVFDVHSLVMFS